ncbi:MAG: DUF4340 domain-containing protein [Nevskia sp.]|nr:DUF4340 domain-containing protein [Nevskia sp.]
MNRKRLNLILALVALALVGVAVLSQKKPPAKGAALTALKAEAVDHIVVHHPDSADLVLQKSAGKWQLSAPVLAAADPTEVAGLSALAEQETHATLEPKEVKLADLGLDPPGFSVTLNNVKLDFGGVEPLSYRRYVQAGSRIYLIDDPAGSTVGADYAHLLSKALLPQGSSIASIAVPGLGIARTADGKGWNVTPADPHAGSDAPQKLADAWSAAQSEWNTAAPAPGSAAAGAAGTGTATVTLGNGQALVFRIVSRDPQFVLARDDLKVQYVLGAGEADRLLKLAVPPPADKAPATAEKKTGPGTPAAPPPAQ